MPTILGANSDTGEYQVTNSGLFGLAGTFLTRTQSDNESDTDRRKFTFSGWYKQTLQGSAGGWNGFWSASADSNNYTSLKLNGDKQLIFGLKISGTEKTFTLDRRFRDPAAWYNIVVAFDSTDGTAADRLKVYVNGERATGTFSADITQNDPAHWGDDASAGRVGAYNNNTGGSYMHNGYMADISLTVGYALGPEAFGKTNDNGVWVPIRPRVVYSANGFLLEFKQTGTSANASGLGADTSGNDNHFTIDSDSISLSSTTDSPTNNFCTMNPILSFDSSDDIDAFTEGNTVVDSNNDTSAAGSTFGVQDGKWYYEAKLTTGNQSSTNFSTGWCQVDYAGQKGTGNGVGFMNGEDNASMDVGGNIIWNNSGNGNQATFGNRSTNDIFQVALDLDNHKMWFGVNGTWSNGSASQSTTFNASSPDFSSIFDTAGVDYMPAFAQSSSGHTVLAYNFGNPSYSISTGHSDDNGYGNFEYEVPSGFYSLCTKNLAEFG